MTPARTKGAIYRCPVCGSELAVLAVRAGRFQPRCCDTDMVLLPRRLAFFVCPVCGAEIAVVRAGDGAFAPRCCDTDMRARAA